jgi:hypothetical protein
LVAMGRAFIEISVRWSLELGCGSLAILMSVSL